MSQWRQTARIAFLTAAATSVVWLVVVALVLQNYRLVPPNSPLLIEAARVDGAAPVDETIGALVVPVEGVRVGQLADTYSQERDGGDRAHDAIDILAPRGTPVLAAAPGRIEKLFVSKAGGNTIYQRSAGGGVIYYYAHLEGYAPGLAEGQMVRAGQSIGTVGSTGNADPAAPHLHFAVWRTRPEARWSDRALALNPYPLLGGR